MSRALEDPWGRHARQWSFVGPPLRPSPVDVAAVDTALRRWGRASGRDDPVVLLMGVTPELCHVARGSRSRMVAVDRSLAMIRSVWPGRVAPRDESVCAVWEALPLRTGSIDFVVGDGTLSTLSFPGGYAVVCEEVRRVLRGDGFWVVRAFVQSTVPETVEAVLTDLGGERTGGFHAFKWRLAMALQEDPETGVGVSDVHRTLLEAEPDLPALAGRRGWPVEEVRTIEAYRDVRARYTFPRRVRIEAMFRNAGFEIVEVVAHSYELGDRCPTFVLAPRDAT